MLNDLQIEYFLTVAETLNFTKSAEKLYVTQSAVSRQIAGIEGELGIVLFDRTYKKIELTEAGALLRDFFIEYRKNFNRVLEKAMLTNKNRVGKVILGYLEGWNLSPVIVQTLHRFSETYPNVEVVLECMSSKELITSLRHEHLDVIIGIRSELDKYKEISVEDYHEIPRVLLYGKNFERENLSLTDFKDETFFTLTEEEAPDAVEKIHECCASFGFVPKIQTVNNRESVLACVQSGIGVAISDGWSRALYNPDLSYMPLDSYFMVASAMNDARKNKEAVILANELCYQMIQPENRTEILNDKYKRQNAIKEKRDEIVR
ncbi:MAG: LysR family transcriptional regulator [Emergencia sp.]